MVFLNLKYLPNFIFKFFIYIIYKKTFEKECNITISIIFSLKQFIMKLKDFIYNKKTKESNLLGVLFVVVVTIVSGAVLYYGFWI